MDLLTIEEQSLVRALGDIWGDFCQVVDRGPTRDADLQEIVHHIHALQHKVLAQAAARAYPNNYRLLGKTL